MILKETMQKILTTQQPPAPPVNEVAWSVAALFAGFFALLVFPAPIALILGIVALLDCNKRSVNGKGRAIFAIIMGATFSLVFIAVIVEMAFL